MKVLSGIDAVHIPRIVSQLEKRPDAFINKCYTEGEKEYALSHKAPARQAEIFAGRFAAKEAVSKALGTGIMSEGIAMTDVEVITDGRGAPLLVLHGSAEAKARELHVISSSVSITHEKDYAAAICVLLCDEEV